MLVKKFMVWLPWDLTVPLMKEHCEYLQEDYGTEHFLHIFDQRIVFSLRASDVVMICRAYQGKCWQRLGRSKLLIKGSGSFGFNLMTVISHRQQTRGKEARLTSATDDLWPYTPLVARTSLPCLGDELQTGKHTPYSPAKDTVVSSHGAVDCLLSLVLSW